MSEKRKRRGLAGVVAFVGTLLVMAKLVGGSTLPADLKSFIESGQTAWVGGIAVLLSAAWMIYDLSENGWADRPVLETLLRYSDRGLFPEPNELASLLSDPKCIEVLKEMSADPWGSITSTASFGMSPEEQKQRALIEHLVDAGLAEWRSDQSPSFGLLVRGVASWSSSGASEDENTPKPLWSGFGEAKAGRLASNV